MSKSSSKEVISKQRTTTEVHDKTLDPWPETSYLSLPRQKSGPKKDDYDSLGDSPSKDDVSNTIEPPDLFNTNKMIAQNEKISSEPIYDTNPKCVYYKDSEVSSMSIQNNVLDEPIYVSKSSTLKHRYQEKTK